MRVAITTDWLDSFGGAERVLLQLHRMYPEAPIFTTVHNPAALPPSMHGLDVRTSFIQRLPGIRRSHMAFFPLMPMAFEQMDLSDYDLVLTTNSACAKGVVTAPGTLNICYCYTPCRYLWDLYHEYTRDHPARFLMAPMAHWMRAWDRLAADRVDHFVAISHEVADRIERHYRRDSEVVYPPVDVERIRPNQRPPEDFYLVVSRLVSYKRVDLAVAAASRLGRRLVVVGRGPEMKRLQAMAGPTVEFRGWLDDAEITKLYAQCRALLFPGYEDFGITPVEAQAAGRPVIAYARGGALETVVDGATGVFFEEQSIDALVAAIERFEQHGWDAKLCRKNAVRFSAEEFRTRLGEAIEQQIARGRGVRQLRAARVVT
jgi:glycosyltransferase involved in cell wall biosynthesis